jgi:hypothetical protein
MPVRGNFTGAKKNYMKKKWLLLMIIVNGVFYLQSYSQNYTQEMLPVNYAINITPNPGHGNFNISIENDSIQSEKTVRLVVYNSSGYIIQNRILAVQNGTNVFPVDISRYTPGNYVVRLIGDKSDPFSLSKQIVLEM